MTVVGTVYVTDLLDPGCVDGPVGEGDDRRLVRRTYRFLVDRV